MLRHISLVEQSAMNRFIERFTFSIAAVLGCHDRVILHGHLPAAATNTSSATLTTGSRSSAWTSFLRRKAYPGPRHKAWRAIARLPPQADGSTARQRYLDHVTAQALDVLRREEVGVLFITPPALAALATRLSDSQREAIHGIHYGGMSLTPETVNDFRAAFPRAVHLAGYGNTLFGVVMEVADAHRLAMDYYPLGERVQFQIVDWPDEAKTPESSPPSLCEQGQSGRVLFHRLDESCLLIGVLERDQAERIAPSPEAVALGGHADGLRNPKAPATLAGRLQMGLY
jgi:hypothetical protein